MTRDHAQALAGYGFAFVVVAGVGAIVAGWWAAGVFILAVAGGGVWVALWLWGRDE